MDNLESLKKEEEKLVKNRRILYFAWVLSFSISVFLPAFVADLKLLEAAPFYVLTLVVYLMWWKTKTKVEKVKEEIEVIEKG